jgi:hypothetical protein
MQLAHKSGLKFNREKCQIRFESIPFFGRVVGADGLLDVAVHKVLLSLNVSPM